jgi:hypothetical protein
MSASCISFYDDYVLLGWTNSFSSLWLLPAQVVAVYVRFVGCEVATQTPVGNQADDSKTQ